MEPTEPLSRAVGGDDGGAPPLPFLLLTAVVTGATVLSIEVMGSRIIGPFFGVSLYVWTALLAVTLLALAGGYALGGVLADRHGVADTLYGLMMAAALAVLAIPVLKAPVLAMSMGAGLRAGTLISSSALFGPPLLALGCVSPLLVRLAAPHARNIGRTVGGLYAVSTLGSVAGAVITGYVLIGELAISDILRLCAGALLLISGIHFLVFRRRLAPLLTLGALALPAPQPSHTPLYMPDGTKVELIASREGAYGTVNVVNYSHRGITIREMTIDGLVQGAIDLDNGLPVYEYAYLMQYLPIELHPGGRRALVVGLGAGVIPRWYESQGVITDVIDIDPAVEALARRHFGFQLSGSVFIADGRQFLSQPGPRYDYLLLDVFSGDVTPAHLLSVEALRKIKSRLEPDGIVAINIIGSLRGRAAMTSSMLRTISNVFINADVYPAFDPQANSTGNLVVVAYDGPPRRLPPGLPGRWPVHPLARPALRGRLARPYTIPFPESGILLTDDFNPVDVHDAWLRERVRREILDTTRWELLLGTLNTGRRATAGPG